MINVNPESRCQNQLHKSGRREWESYIK